MNISKPFIYRPVMTVLVMMSILFFGISAYNSLPVSDLPNVDMPVIEVTITYPGANPETMANSIATPLEQQFMAMQGIQTVISSSNTGTTHIVLIFDLDRDIDDAATDVQQAITTAQPRLPTNLPNNPTYQKVNPASTPILYFVLINPNMTLGELYDYGNTFIGERLALVEGISQVTIYGSPYAARIQLDPEKLAAKNIGIDEVEQSIGQGTVNLPLGTLWGQRDNSTIDVDGQLMKADGYSELVIKNQDGGLVKIKDVGRALDSVQNDKYFMHLVNEKSDQTCIIMAVQRDQKANTVRAVKGVNELLSEMKSQIPDTMEIYRIYDQSETIREGIRDVQMTLAVSIFLVVFIIYLMLGKVLNTVIPFLALIMTLVGNIIAMFLIGFSIDILSLLAMTLSIGFLIDDAIVVLENNVRHVQKGETSFQAALNSSKEISVTVMSMTICLCAAFIPMVFMGGVIGRLFREFGLTIIIAVLISGFLALSLTPMLCSRFVKPYAEEKKTRMERMAETINDRMKKSYERGLRWAMRHRITMVLAGIGSIFCSILLFAILPRDFLPPDDVGFIEGYTIARDGTSPYLMEKYHDEINKISIANPNVDSILSINSFTNPNEGILFLRLKEFHKREKMYPVIQELEKKFADVPGVVTTLSPLPLIDLTVGTTSFALYQYSMTSIDIDTLYDYTSTLIDRMKQNPNFSQVSSDLRNHQPQWTLRIDRDKASNYNVTASQIENFFQYAYSDNKIAQINSPINTYDVLIETLPQFYRDPSVLSKLYVRSTNDNLVPLSEILDVSETAGPLTVNRYNGFTAVNISFNPAPGVPLGQALQSIEELTADIPLNIRGRVIGTADIFKNSLQSLNFLMLLSFFVIYIVLGILYESFIHPLTVMSALPPTLLGGLLTLYVFGQPLSIYSFVGLILLVGIVLKNGIMMVDFANEAVEKEKKSAADAIVEAALIRFRPIVMTTVSALMGAVPIAIGIGGGVAQNRISLGLCVVGGLLVSQLLTLLLTPVLFYYFESLQERLFAFIERHKKK